MAGVVVCNLIKSNFLYWTAIPAGVCGVVGVLYGYSREVNCIYCLNKGGCEDRGEDNYPNIYCKNYDDVLNDPNRGH
ncbi:MAG: hypothetical protein ABH840_02140 [Nanoarchaeota archaeon]